MFLSLEEPYQVLQLKREIITLELRHIQIYASSREKHCLVRKNSSDNSSFDLRGSPLRPPFSCHTNQKLGSSNVLYYKTKDPIELKRCETSISYGGISLMKLKPQRARLFCIYFGIQLRHMKSKNKSNLFPRVLSTSTKYPGYGWSSVYECQPKPHRGWVLDFILLTLSREVNVSLLYRP